MDEAILHYEPIDTNKWKKIDEIPFDFERRRISILLDNEQQRQLIVKGAAEDIISICTHYETNGRIKYITPAIRNKLLGLYKQESKKDSVF